MAQWLKNLARIHEDVGWIHEDVGSIPGLALWVKDLAVL